MEHGFIFGHLLVQRFQNDERILKSWAPATAPTLARKDLAPYMTEPNTHLVLEKAQLELTNVRTQLVLGMLCVFISCLVNHFNHLFSFAVCLGLCLFLGLITLEITGRFGNRLGASAACWAALLFSAYPLHYEPTVPVVDYSDMLMTLLGAVCLFGLLRFLLIREMRYAGVALFAATSLVALGWVTEAPHHLIALSAEENSIIAGCRHLQDLVFPVPFGAQAGLLRILLSSIYTVLLFLLIVRLILRTVNIKIPLFLIVCTPFVSCSPSLFPFLFCLFLSFMALPVIDHAKYYPARLISYIGIACLSALFLTWCQINRMEQKSIVPSPLELPRTTLLK